MKVIDASDSFIVATLASGRQVCIEETIFYRQVLGSSQGVVAIFDHFTQEEIHIFTDKLESFQQCSANFTAYSSRVIPEQDTYKVVPLSLSNESINCVERDHVDYVKLEDRTITPDCTELK